MVYGWRKALATMHIGHHGLRGQVFTMSSAIENYMSKEDLGPEASKKDRSDLKTLREQLRWWEETIYTLGHPEKERNRWFQVPSMGHGRRKSLPRN